MAHFAELDENNIVISVIVVNNSDCGNIDFPFSESIGQDYLETVFGGNKKRWVQTSYNNKFRCRYASIGYFYMQEHDVFVAPALHSYFVFDSTKMEWVPPIPYPNNNLEYVWDDSSRNWIPTFVLFTSIGE
jgi:hypothetical protein